MLDILEQLDESVFTDELKAELSEKFESAVEEKSELRAQEIVAEKEIEYEAYIAEESEKAKAELLDQLSEYMEEVVEAYYKGMPGAIGFANGYRPGHTFAVYDGRPFISFDYYLSETRDEEAASDLIELSNLNEIRPYFLLMHVREYSDIERVKRILKKLGPEFELVPLDVFTKLAGNQPTYKTNFAE